MTSKNEPSKPSPSARKPTRRHASAQEGRRIRLAALAERKDDQSGVLRLSASEEIVITRHEKSAGVLIGFESEDDRLDHRMENDPEFPRRVGSARRAIAEGRGVRLEDLPR